MKKKIALIVVILSIALTACGVRAASPSEDYQTGYGGGGAPESLPAPTMGPALAYTDSAKADTGGVTVATNATTSDRLVIKNADLTIVVADPQKKLDAIVQMAESMGGFVVSSNIYQTYTPSGEQVPEGYISIRVPADKLNTALSQIKSDAVEVRSETQTGQDVTASYVDLQSQLTNLEMAEKDLQAIMDEAKNNPNSSVSSKTQDVLAVYNQIVAVRGQIEQIKGQMKYYEESAAFSLINVSLIAEETVQPIEVGGWKPEGTARDAVQTLVNFLQGFVDFVIWIVIFVLPMLIVIFGPIALVVWGIIALVKRGKVKKAKVSKQ
ncbi:MAG: hypothetical protein FD146_1699 [Anaerolineaceae bacterium]|nr:MAG: hypothetical protein FD146_1699 [Anaerolineaceae bacterium]